MIQARAFAIGLTLLFSGAVPRAFGADAASRYTLEAGDRIESITTDSGTTSYRYFDNGSIQEMVDPAGRRYSFVEGDAPATLAAANPNFLPFLAASVANPLDQSANRFVFTGFAYERELGLYLTPSGRLYDPAMGRFTQADSYLGSLSDPGSLHRYLYGHANPGRFIDPSGHSDKDANRLAAAMDQRTGFFASDHRPAEQRGWWYNALSEVYLDLPPRLVPMRQLEGLARQDAAEFAVGTGESVLAALVPEAVKRGAGALVERFPILGRSVTEAAGEALARLRAPELPATAAEVAPTPVKTVSVAEATQSDGVFVATEEGRLAPAASRIAGGSQGADVAITATDLPRVGKWVGKEVRGRTVFQRDDIFDPLATDDTGLTNVQRMEAGRAPIGFDGRPINLHHLTQTEPGSLAEIPAALHGQYSKQLHGLVEPKRSFRYSPEGKTTEADKAFKQYSRKYWQERAKDFQQ
jgi:RHS repeat-associated protein